VIGVTVGAIPTGATLTDGTYSFTATDLAHLVNVSSWNLAGLSITPPSDFVGQFSLSVVCSAMESATGEVANTAITLPVTVLAANSISPLVTNPDSDGMHTNELDEKVGCFDQLENGHALNSGWILANDGFYTIGSKGRFDERNEQFEGEVGGRTAPMADAYFEMGKVAGVATQLDQPIQTVGLSNEGMDIDWKVREQFVPKMDWSANPDSSILSDDNDSSKKSRNAKSSWVSSFIGAEKESKPNAASLSKLSVNLKGKK